MLASSTTPQTMLAWSAVPQATRPGAKTWRWPHRSQRSSQRHGSDAATAPVSFDLREVSGRMGQHATPPSPSSTRATSESAGAVAHASELEGQLSTLQSTKEAAQAHVADAELELESQLTSLSPSESVKLDASGGEQLRMPSVSVTRTDSLSVRPRVGSSDLRIPEHMSREMLLNTFLSACERVRGAADLPERLVIEKLRPLWTPVLGDDEFFLDFHELNEGLRQAGVAGRRAIKQISKARSRYPVTEATLTAAATLHILIPEPSLRRAGYCSIEQVKEHVRFIVKHSSLSDSRLPKLFAALDVWYPAYEWDRDECGEDNRSPGWADPELLASLK